MARIRTIKPEFFTSEDIVCLSPLARLFYVSLWCESDRAGRFEWKPKTFKLRYLPGDSCDVDMLAQELFDAGLVILYEANGKTYAEIPTFEKHQVINNRESESTIPPRVNHASITRESGRKEGMEGKGRKGKDSGEPSQSDDSSPTSQPVVSIPMVDGSEYPVTAEMIAEWSQAYPAVDVEQQLREMRAWSVANQANRKTPRGVNSFIVRWLSKDQDRGRNGRHQQNGNSDIWAGAVN